MDQLTRSRENKILGGVAAGIAERYNMDVTIVRLVFVAAGLFTQILGIAAYGILWAVLPEKGSQITGLDRLNDRYNDYRQRRNVRSDGIQDAPRDNFNPYHDDEK